MNNPSTSGSPTDLRCEYFEYPLGIDAARPRFSWVVPALRRGMRQTAYRIVVGTDEPRVREGHGDVWDSGMVASEQSAQIAYAGPPLLAGRRYFWSVQVWDEHGRASLPAAPAWFEMGLLEPSDWRARWIMARPPQAQDSDAQEYRPFRAQCLRREFDLSGPVRRARAYVSGLGCYELRINGARVGGDVLTPGWTTYERRIQYQTYDVTALLRPGPNAVGAILGNGWWSSGLGIGRGEFVHPGTPGLLFILQLRAELADGRVQEVITDEGWRSHPAPIVENTLYHGEEYDAGLEQPGWDAPGFRDADWTPVTPAPQPAGRLVAEQTHPIRVSQELHAGRLNEPQPGTYVFDFGQNHAGRCRLRLRGEPGRRVQLRFAEVLNADGTLDRRNLVGARATDAYVFRSNAEETWEPRFTYHGYRYAELTGAQSRPSADALVSQVLHSALPPAGEFECSNELINRIQHLIVWALRSNLFSVPTDCPQRDERLGWLGDMHVFAPTACWNLDMANFLAKWVRDIRDGQTSDGAVRDVAPAVVVRGPAAPGWGDALLGVPWTLYHFYRDAQVIEENYDAMRAWVEYMNARAPGHLYHCTHTFAENGYGDWVAVEPTPKDLIAAAFFFYSTDLLARMASVVGRTDDARRYAELAGRIGDAFNQAYFDAAAGSYAGGTQTANLLPLAFGLVPPEHRSAVLEKLVADIRARDDHLTTGFLGTAYLLPILSNHGYHELAYRLATQRTYPSWGHMIEVGATTMTERWNPASGDTRMNSWNHFALGAVGQWFYESLAGINYDPNQPGFARCLIRPRPAGDLTWVRARYRSVRGLISCHWRRSADAFEMEVTIPGNTPARIELPALGSARPTVQEGTVTLLRGGRPAEPAEGIAFRRLDPDGSIVLDAAPGTYWFRVTP